MQRALRSLSTQLSGAQVGITLTNLAIGFLAEPASASLVETPLEAVGVRSEAVPGIAVAIGLVLATGLTMVVGELVPKNLAIAAPVRTAKGTQLLMRTFTTAMAFPIRVLNGSANAIVRRLGVEPQEELRSARSPDEVQARTGVALPVHKDYRTVGGLVLRLLGRIPATGDAVTVALAPVFGDDGTPHHQAATLRVARMDGQWIDRVAMTVEDVTP